MSQTQKIIKYIAISFAVFLIITIISGIFIGSYTLLSSLGLIDTNKDIVTDNLKTISTETLEISSLEIDLAYTNLYIKTGEKFEVKTNNTKITFKNDNGNIKIAEENILPLINKNIESNLIVYIKENMNIINKVNIDTSSGKINIENLNTKVLLLDLGVTEVHIKDVISTEKTYIDGGIGKTELINCNLNNLETDLGVGEFKFNGILTGKNEINSAVGLTNIDLTSKKENYTINTNKGIGKITLDGEKIESDRIYGTGINYLEVDGGIGEIKINFRD